MADVTCPIGHALMDDGSPGVDCDARCVQAGRSADPRPVAGGVRVDVAGVRIELPAGERLLLGREGDPRVAAALQAGFGNVSRSHLEIVVGTGDVVSVRPHTTTNGTFLGRLLLDPDVERTVHLPATVRMAVNCHVMIDPRPGP